MGEYKMTMSGKYRWNSGLAFIDTDKWMPKYARFEIYKGVDGKTKLRDMNFLGMIYGPLILIDRALIHESTNIFEDF